MRASANNASFIAMGAFDRRSVLFGAAGVVTTATLASCRKPQEDAPPAPVNDAQKDAAAAPMTAADVVPLLVAIADRIVPTDDLGPGVRDLGADVYFTNVLADPRMKQVKSIVTRGAVWLNNAAKKEQGVGFAQLPDAAKDDLIQRMADNKVRPNGVSPQAFVKVMLALALEAFLGDPRHGGNAGGKGWDSLGGLDWSGRKALHVVQHDDDNHHHDAGSAASEHDSVVHLPRSTK